MQLEYPSTAQGVDNLLSFLLLAQPSFHLGGILERSVASWFATSWNRTDYFLSTILSRYLIDHREEAEAFNGVLPSENSEDGPGFGNRIPILSEMILNSCAPFAEEGGQVKDNLIHLKNVTLAGRQVSDLVGVSEDEISNFVNTAVVPASLRSISSLAAVGLVPAEHGLRADKYAQVWEDSTLQFFEVNIPEATSQPLLAAYLAANQLESLPGHANASISFYGPSIRADWNAHAVLPVMTLQDCFRLYLLNTTSDAQMSKFLDQTANLIVAPYPLGLAIRSGFAITNTVFLEGSLSENGTTPPGDLHARSDQSWLLPAMAVGLARQLDQCKGSSAPEFCSDEQLRSRVVKAYDALWSELESVDLGDEIYTGSTRPCQKRDSGVKMYKLGLKKQDLK